MLNIEIISEPIDYLRGEYIAMSVLEKYEWCDFWWEKTDCNDKPRVLLIGDSITRAYRPKVNVLLKDYAHVDMLATSKAVDNGSLIKEINYILNHEEFKYKVIHFNNGLHGLHLSDEDYQKGMEDTVKFIIENCSTARLVVALTTPVTLEGEKSTLNPKLNALVVGRNDVVDTLAAKYNLEVDDLYTPMLGKSEFRVDDGFHYTNEGETAQAKIVAEKLTKLL